MRVSEPVGRPLRPLFAMLNIEIVSDVVCPWCFIGLRRLSAAIELVRQDTPGFACRKRWLPFFLNPDTPPEGEPYRAFLEGKFGGPVKAESVLDQVREAAAGDGLQYAFERIATRPNTLAAHRLLYRAQAHGHKPERVRALAHALFAAHFQEGRDIGDLDTLAELAAACGDRRDLVREWLESGADADKVQRMAAGLRRQGIDGVPFFILDRRLSLSGAQSAAVIGAALLQALETGKPS